MSVAELELQFAAALAQVRRKKFRLLAGYFRFGGEAISPRASTPAFLAGATSRFRELWQAREPGRGSHLEKFPCLILALGLDEPQLDKPGPVKALATVLDSYLTGNPKSHEIASAKFVLYSLVSDQESFDKLRSVLDAVAPHFPKRAVDKPSSREALVEQLERELTRERANLAWETESIFEKYTGFEPASESDGQQLAQQINGLLSRQGLALRFPALELPAVLAYKTLGRYRKCHFVLSQADQRDMFVNCGVKLPRLHVMPLAAGIEPAQRRIVQNIEELRRRMKEVAAQSGLSLAEIGERMGVDPKTHPQTRVWWLMNRSESPPIFNLLKFCEATKTRIEDLLGA